MQVSFIIAAYNRRDVLLGTLGSVYRCGLPPEQFEVFVVDNASEDATPDAVRERFPTAIVIEAGRNHGPCAKNLALPLARGHYVVFLDDDSWPTGNSVARMIRHFEANPRLGAAGFTVNLPDGSRECSAYPNVFIGCGVGLRRRALEAVGGLPDDFFMAAEEYDLSLRLLAAGWAVRTFDDMAVAHLKTPTARSSSRIARFDVRNNLTLVFRYFPDAWVEPFARDWIGRYAMMARVNGHRHAHWRGLAEGVWRGLTGTQRTPLSSETFEAFARIAQIRQRLAEVARAMGLRRVLFVDLGKNALPYYLAAKACGLDVIAMADQRLGGHGFKYHGIPILSDAEAARLDFDAAVISNLSPVHAAARRGMWRARQLRPVIDLFERPTISAQNVGRLRIGAGWDSTESRQTVARSA